MHAIQKTIERWLGEMPARRRQVVFAALLWGSVLLLAGGLSTFALIQATELRSATQRAQADLALIERLSSQIEAMRSLPDVPADAANVPMGEWLAQRGYTVEVMQEEGGAQQWRLRASAMTPQSVAQLLQDLRLGRGLDVRRLEAARGDGGWTLDMTVAGGRL